MGGGSRDAYGGLMLGSASDTTGEEESGDRVRLLGFGPGSWGRGVPLA